VESVARTSHFSGLSSELSASRFYVRHGERSAHDQRPDHQAKTDVLHLKPSFHAADPARRVGVGQAAAKKDDPEALSPVVRVPQVMRERLARVRDAMAKRAALATLDVPTVVREALDRGLTELEGELGIAKGKR